MNQEPTLTNVRAERVRSVAALSRRAVRERSGLFLAEGPQAVREAVTIDPTVVRDVFVTAEAATTPAVAAILVAAQAGDLPIQTCSESVLAAMADTNTPQGLVAVCRSRTGSLEAVLAAEPRLLVILAQVRDPGNAGTVIRAADAAGADAVVVTDSSVDVFSPKVVRSTAGSLFHLPVVTSVPTLSTIEQLQARGVTVLAADGAGTIELPQAARSGLLSGPHAWLMGNEAWGLPAEVRGHADAVVRVPIYGNAESLNLAVATAVCLYQSAFVQRGAASI